MGPVLDEHQARLDTTVSCRCGEKSRLDVRNDDEDDQRSELSYVEPEVAQDASPAPVPSSAPPEESTATTPAVSAAPGPPSPVPFVQPVHYLTFNSEEERQRFFELRRRMHLRMTTGEFSDALGFDRAQDEMMEADLEVQAREIRQFDEDLAEQHAELSPRSEGFFLGEDQGQTPTPTSEGRLVEIEEIPDKAEDQPHEVRSLIRFLIMRS
jgi:type IV secretory pathway VirB10-like protein